MLLLFFEAAYKKKHQNHLRVHLRRSAFADYRNQFIDGLVNFSKLTIPDKDLYTLFTSEL